MQALKFVTMAYHKILINLFFKLKEFSFEFEF